MRLQSKVHKRLYFLLLIQYISATMLYGVIHRNVNNSYDFFKKRKPTKYDNKIYENIIKLQSGTINTLPTVKKVKASGIRTDKIESYKQIIQKKLSANQTFPFMIQFNGPIHEEWKKAVKQAGGKIKGYIPNNALLVEIPLNAIAKIAAISQIQWIGEYKPKYKLDSFLFSVIKGTRKKRKQFQRKLRRETKKKASIFKPQEHIVTIQSFSSESIILIVKEIQTLGGKILASASGKQRGYIRAKLTPDTIMYLTQFAEIEWIELYIEPKLYNDVAAKSNLMNVKNVWDLHGLTGKGQIIGHADTGLDIGVNDSTLHPDFTNRVKAAFALGRLGDWSDNDGHGTHTAGSILGNGSTSGGQFKGIAYEAELVHQSIEDNDGYLSGLPLDLNEMFETTYNEGARIHSDSWGGNAYGMYTIYSRQADEFM